MTSGVLKKMMQISRSFYVMYRPTCTSACVHNIKYARIYILFICSSTGSNLKFAWFYKSMKMSVVCSIGRCHELNDNRTNINRI